MGEIIILKCNICSNEAEYVYKIKKSEKGFNNISVNNQRQSGRLSGIIFLCNDHYIRALDENW